MREEHRTAAFSEGAALGIDEARLDVLDRDAGELAHPRGRARERNERGDRLDDRQAEVRKPGIAVAGRARARVALAAGTEDQARATERRAVRERDLPAG